MSLKNWIVVGMMSATLASAPHAHGKDIKITIPKRSHLTAVQRLNQQGVEDIRKHHYEKAEAIFYKAYLLDPDDPFTLNNLGYIAELQGQVNRAHQFYTLASQQSSGAVIAMASTPKLQGKSVKDMIAGIQDRAMQANQANVEAVRLLADGRPSEAE